MALGGLEDAYVKYWDEGSMIAVLEFEVEQSSKSGQEQASKEKKEKKKKGLPSVSCDFFPLTPTIKTVTTQDIPKEATVLPLLDKPVTLSFNKGGPSTNRPALAGEDGQDTSLSGSAKYFSVPSASKMAPVSLGFSLAEEGDGQDDSDVNGGDSKGLSHASRCARIIFWMCELTMRHAQLLSLRKSHP